MSTVSFLAQLDWNFLPAECFPLTYDLSLLSLELIDTFYLSVLSKQLFMFPFSLSYFACNSMPRSSSSVLHGVNPN